MNLAAKIPVKCIQRVNEFANTHSVRSWFSCLSFVAKILQKLGKNILTDCNHFNSSSTTVLALSKEAQVCALSRYSFPTGSHVSDSGAYGKDKERHVSNEAKQKWMIQSIKWSSHVCLPLLISFLSELCTSVSKTMWNWIVDQDRRGKRQIHKVRETQVRGKAINTQISLNVD